MERLKTPDGKNAGAPLRLADFQREIIMRVYDDRLPSGTRQITDAALSTARKNGKTSFIAGLVLGHLCGPEAVPLGQVYSAAFDRNQAAIIHKLASTMVLLDDSLNMQERLHLKDHAKQIIDRVSGSVYTALSAESRSKHGFSSSCAVFDELAQFGSNRTLYDVLRTSGGARDDALFWVISTQAPDDAALLSELLDYAKQCAEGVIDDPTTVAWVYSIPEDLDPYDENNWHLANPALGIFRSLTEMRQFATKAEKMPSAERTFLNLYCNRRISTTATLISPSRWAACAAEPELDDAMVWYGGLDLSSKLDLTAYALAGVTPDGKIAVKVWFWTPADTLDDRAMADRAPYHAWRSRGFLETVPGAAVDYDFVARRISEINSEYRTDKIFFDRWRIEDFRKACERQQIEMPLEELGQGYKDMSPAVDDFEEAVASGTLRHGANPVLTWNVSNLAVEVDPAANRKPTKKRSTGRIDGAVAVMMAIRCLTVENGGVSIYEESDLFVI